MENSEKKQPLSDLPNDFLKPNDENTPSSNKDSDFVIFPIERLDYEHFVNLYKRYQTLTTIDDVLDFWAGNLLMGLVYSIDHLRKEVEISHPAYRSFGKSLEDLRSNDIYQNTPDWNFMILPIQEETIFWCMSFNFPREIQDFDEFLAEYSRTIQISPLPDEKIKLSLRDIESKIQGFEGSQTGISRWLNGSHDSFEHSSFLTGYKDCIQGIVETKSIINCLKKIPLMKEINTLIWGIQNYWDGVNAARIKSFLLEQKKRLEKGEDIRYPANTDTSKPMQELPISPKTWQGDKNDLVELIYALDKSKRIRDPNTGEKVTQKDLIKMFEFMFGVKLNKFSDLLREKLKSYDAADGKTFFNELKGIIDAKVKELNPPK